MPGINSSIRCLPIWSGNVVELSGEKHNIASVARAVEPKKAARGKVFKSVENPIAAAVEKVFTFETPVHTAWELIFPKVFVRLLSPFKTGSFINPNGSLKFPGEFPTYL